MRHLLLLFLILGASGCASSWYIGEWTVTEARFPGISAMGVDEAREWYGAEAVYAASSVTFRDESCEQPRFTASEMDEAAFTRAYRTTFSALDIEGLSVRIVEVGCPDNWVHPGALLIEAGPESGYIVWDGVFFKMLKSD